MKLFAVIYVMGAVQGMLGPFDKSARPIEDVQACHVYVLNLKPQIDAAWNDPDKLKVLNEQFPEATKDDVLIKCEDIKGED